jgi:hypothetical protein
VFLIPLTRGRFARVDNADYARIVAHRWYCAANGYAARSQMINGKQRCILMHREILRFPDEPQIDHANGDTLDNRRSNLRPCSSAENMRNRNGKKGGAFKGIWRHSGCNRFQAEITIDGGKRLHLGLFKTAEEAARAYDAAAVEHFGEFARLNFPPQTKEEAAPTLARAS